MTVNVKSIETVYNGYRFRSRLEARWAVFFDNAYIKYEYEPEGFEVNWADEVYRYLPDFYLPELKVYVEVKPSLDKLMEEQEKISYMIDYRNTPISDGLLILGQIPNYQSWYEGGKPIAPKFLFYKWNKGVESYLAVIDSTHGKPKLFLEDYGLNTSAPELPSSCINDDLTYYAYGMSIDIDGYYFKMSDHDWSNISEDMRSAYNAARQARFEHGEKPKKRK